MKTNFYKIFFHTNHFMKNYFFIKKITKWLDGPHGKGEAHAGIFQLSSFRKMALVN